MGPCQSFFWYDTDYTIYSVKSVSCQQNNWHQSFFTYDNEKILKYTFSRQSCQIGFECNNYVKVSVVPLLCEISISSALSNWSNFRLS